MCEACDFLRKMTLTKERKREAKTYFTLGEASYLTEYGSLFTSVM